MSLAEAPLKTSKDAADSFPAGQLWQDSPVLLVVLRRPGCRKFCRRPPPAAASGLGAKPGSHTQTPIQKHSLLTARCSRLTARHSLCLRSPTRCSAVPRAGDQAVERPQPV